MVGIDEEVLQVHILFLEDGQSLLEYQLLLIAHQYMLYHHLLLRIVFIHLESYLFTEEL